MAFGLTALPAPNVLEILNYDTILASLVSQFRGLNKDYTSIVEGDPAYTILQAIAWQEIMTRQRINDAARAVLVTHAVGADLDNLGELFAVHRQVITPADLTADPPVEEVLEGDVRYRDRILNALESIAPGSRAWYRGYTLEASSLVKDAVALKTNPGEITVYVQADNVTAVPDGTLLTTVRNYLNDDERKFLCDTVNVVAISVESYTLTATIKPVLGLDRNLVLADIRSRANEFVKERKIIGQPIPLSHIYAALITDAISEITLTSPTANIEPTETEVPVASSVTITLGA